MRRQERADRAGPGRAAAALAALALAGLGLAAGAMPARADPLRVPTEMCRGYFFVPITLAPRDGDSRDRTL